MPRSVSAKPQATARLERAPGRLMDGLILMASLQHLAVIDPVLTVLFPRAAPA